MNLDKPVIEIYHKNLKRASPDDSHYRSICPCCPNGILFVMRQQESPFILMPLDCCVSCGQQFFYLDLAEINNIDSMTELSYWSQQ